MTPASYLFLCGDVQVRLGFVKEKVLIYVAAGFVARTGVVRLWLGWQMYLCKERTIDTEKESSTGQDTSVIFTDDFCRFKAWQQQQGSFTFIVLKTVINHI